MLIIPGPASQILSLKIAEKLKANVVSVEHKFFPDGESYLRLERDLKGEKVAVVQSIYPPQDTHLIQLLLLIHTASRLGASEITVVAPYLAYARQDKAFRQYEAVSAEAVLHLLATVGLHQLVTVDVHTPAIFNLTRFKCINLSAVGILAEHFKKLNISEPTVIAPDDKAVKMANEASLILEGKVGRFRKKRNKVTGEIQMTMEDAQSLEGKDAIIFDDMISSGGTIAMTAKLLKEKGARRVYAACTHPLLTENAHRRILDSGAEEVVGTDTIPSNVSLVSVADLIAEALRRIVV